MTIKYIFVTGGVVSGLGKGVAAASLGRLLKSRGFTVTMQKMDPYLNVDPGTMNPTQHGEVFVTDDGAEADLDLGHYERFIDESLDKNSNVTTGKVFWEILQKERRGEFGGGTVQIIPHVTNEIQSRFFGYNTLDFNHKQKSSSVNDTQIAIIEVGGTVGDIESQPFLEAIRQFQRKIGHRNCIIIHVTLIPYLRVSQELKTKPTQQSIKQLQMSGIWPDLIVCRTEHELDDSIKGKLALFCNVEPDHVIQNLDVDYLYELPLVLEKENFAQVVCQTLKMECPSPDLSDWIEVCNSLKNPKGNTTIAIVGKYTALHDSYISVVEALKHGGIASHCSVTINWVNSEELNSENVSEILKDVNVILVPGGFGERGIEGKIEAIKYARVNKIPFLGICLGLQLAIVEFARNILGYTDAHSTELNPKTTHPVIHLMENQNGVTSIGGTLRLGAYPCVLDKDSKCYQIYGNKENISERHRHRYEVNNEYRDELIQHGMTLSGQSPDGKIVEMIELIDHPFFVATQAHPEFKSRPNLPHPLFRSFIAASLSK